MSTKLLESDNGVLFTVFLTWGDLRITPEAWAIFSEAEQIVLASKAIGVVTDEERQRRYTEAFNAGYVDAAKLYPVWKAQQTHKRMNDTTGD